MEKIWITRIKGHILGPFSNDEISEMVESKKLSIKDEVNKSLKQWVYVQNASELYDFSSQTKTDVPLVKKRRESTRKNWMEDTVILDSPLELPETEKEDNTKTAQVIEEQNQKPISKELDLEHAEVIDYKVDEFEEPPPESDVQFETIDQVRKKASIKSQKAARYIWVLILILSASASLFYFSKYTEQSNPSAVLDNLSEGHKLFNQGEYAKALDIFKKSHIENDSDRLKLASMLVQLEEDIYQAQINIEKMNNLSPLDQSRLQILKGIIANKNNNPLEAEALFDQALSHSPFLGTLHKVMLNIKNREQALKILDQTDFTNEEVQNNKNLLLLLKAYLEPVDKEDNSALTELLMSTQGDYRQGAFLLLLHRQILTNKEEYNQTVKQVLDQDPYLTQEYRSDILSYTPRFIWKELLLDVCSRIEAQMESKSHFIAVKSLCLTQSGLSIEALKNIEKARTQSPGDPLISSMYVFISSQNNLDEYTLLDHSLKQNKHYILPLILKARLCQNQQDAYCTHNNWSQVRQKNHLSLSAITGEAWSYFKMDKNEEARSLVQAGLLISNRYKPLLQLKDSL